ncbi:type VI secretion system tube protein Hcp [Dyadobacter arcticus]|uniref:Type VI protein secretion system component Hcp n=1 Tax=Dyadobacter arcticus TaxID=1078754 RepID=A0ABX0UMQ2_9BACT|nr:type VI secretion system tube protein Hcp [Dyadobacter arcticus]NIJ52945.1 type VI protein secretion system component Hcp [Dyadobacter arcticus]
MKRKFYFLSIALLLVALASEAQNIYLYYPPVTTGAGPGGIHADEVPLGSVQGGIGRGISAGSGREASAPALSEYTLSKVYDKSSTAFLRLATYGPASLENYEIRFYSGEGAGEVLVLRIELAEVLISGYSIAGQPCPTGNCPIVSESLSLNFTKIRITDETNDQLPVYEWDIVRNRPNF